MPPPWPILTRYDSSHLARIALPLGGIGTGTISLGGRGNLHDFEVMNQPAKGSTPEHCFATLWAKPARGPAVTRCLEGALQPPFEGAFGSTVPNHGLPRFRSCRFLAAYPFGQVELSDPDVPLRVTLQAFNPLVPGDAEASSLPIAVLRYVLRNPGSQPVRAAVALSMENFIGFELWKKKPSKNINSWRASRHVRGLFMRSNGVDANSPQWGTLALATIAEGEVTHRTGWLDQNWCGPLLDFWDDFSADGRLEERSSGIDNPRASLAPMVVVPPRSERSVTFIVAWHFPNRMTWSPAPQPEKKDEKKDDAKAAPTACGPEGCGPGGCGDPDRIGNHYTSIFGDAWEVIESVAPRLAELEARTLSFVSSFCASDLPAPVKEAALCNVSTLRSQTTFRTPDGRLFGWEGCGDNAGCCNGSCTHVWNYELTTPFLFGDLARTMREVEFAHATDPATGLMCFRTNLPLSRARGWIMAAADGQMGCLLKLHREWQLSGDERMLRSLWPNARKALEFAWVRGGWDGDRDGVMEGCQHNTMDVEYYGPNPQMQFWYLGALRAAEEMARHLGEAEFAATCRDLFTRGSRWIDRHLFNGDYYEHEVRPMRAEDIAAGTRTDMGAKNLEEPELQIGAGCLVDQLVGQLHAHISGLGHLADPKKIAKALASVKRYNFKRGMYGHFNPMRSYALSDESALLMASYPRGRRPKRPFPYYPEVMTGFEHTAAIGMIQEGLEEDGLECIAAVRARYDGARRSPFNEAECGHHYARAMAAWGAVLALTGFRFSAVAGTMTFRASTRTRRWFWSNGSAWGTVALKPGRTGTRLKLTVLHGELSLRRLELTGGGAADFAEARLLRAGGTLAVDIARPRPTRRPAARRRAPARAR